MPNEINKTVIINDKSPSMIVSTSTRLPRKKHKINVNAEIARFVKGCKIDFAITVSRNDNNNKYK